MGIDATRPLGRDFAERWSSPTSSEPGRVDAGNSGDQAIAAGIEVIAPTSRGGRADTMNRILAEQPREAEPSTETKMQFARCRRDVGSALTRRLGAGVGGHQDPLLARLDSGSVHAPFFIALYNGYYKAEGLDVTIDRGKGSAGLVQQIASGVYDMGYPTSAWSPTSIRRIRTRASRC